MGSQGPLPQEGEEEEEKLKRKNYEHKM